MLASPLPPSFLETYSRSTSSLGCNALCIVISFLVLLSICLSSSLVHLIMGPEYLTRGTAQVFIPLIWFLQLSFVSSSFLVLLRYYYNNYYYYCYYYYYYSRTIFNISVSRWSFAGVWAWARHLTSCKTLLSILVDLSIAVVWWVSTCPQVSIFQSLLQAFGDF